MKVIKYVSKSLFLTADERKRRNMTQDDLCPRCHSCPETLMYWLRDCEDIKELWSNIIHPMYGADSLFLVVYVLFGVAMCDIWKDRNSLVF